MFTLDWTYQHIGEVERKRQKNANTPSLFRSLILIEISEIEREPVLDNHPVILDLPEIRSSSTILAPKKSNYRIGPVIHRAPELNAPNL